MEKKPHPEQPGLNSKVEFFVALPTQSPSTPEPDTTLLQGRQLALVFRYILYLSTELGRFTSQTHVNSAFMAAFSLVALDQTILTTPLPTIASHFHAVSDLSWIASAYFLPQVSFFVYP